MIKTPLPSVRLIVLMLLLAAAAVALAFAPLERPWVTGIVGVGASLLLLAAVADALVSLSHWRRQPLRLHRRLPQAFAVGASVNVQLTLENAGGVRRRGWLHEYGDPSFAMPGMPVAFDIGPGQKELLEVTLTPHARGLKQFEPAQIRLSSRWGLADLNLRIGETEQRRVFPNFAQQARFAWLAGEQRLAAAGIKSVQRRGAGTDFDQLVEYQAGDPIRHMDWKATGKLDRPIVRKFRDERDQTVMLMLDCGRRMRADDISASIGTSHFDQALNAAMLLAFVALSHGDAVGAVTFGSPDGTEKRFAPRKGRGALNSLMAALADVEPTPTFSDYERAAVDVLQRLRKRALIIIITNSRNEDATEISSALQLLGTRHRVVLANLREQVVADIAKQPLRAPADALECAAAVEYMQAREVLLARIAQRGVITIDCEPPRLAVELVNRYTVLKRTGGI